jgi:hypothetical protein
LKKTPSHALSDPRSGIEGTIFGRFEPGWAPSIGPATTFHQARTSLLKNPFVPSSASR